MLGSVGRPEESPVRVQLPTTLITGCKCGAFEAAHTWLTNLPPLQHLEDGRWLHGGPGVWRLANIRRGIWSDVNLRLDLD